MNRKLINGLAVVAGVVFLGWFAATPYLAAKALGEAAERGDARALERLVDFPALRDSMKTEFNERLVGEMRARGEDDPLGGLGAFLGPAIISGAVDALVTPQAVSLMVRSGKTPKAGETPPAADDRPEPKRSLGYRDPNTFAIRFEDAERDDRSVTLLMKRRGVFGWKLAAIDLPETPPPAA
ncbi:MAG: DUF2939 domain-containing protein [Caulobacteraceae bacterium]|nr:DUF2939 domain-containing protein [Caulobacteraceae bacterium]